MNDPARRFTSGIREVAFGEGVTVVEPVNLYECAIGDATFVGPFVEIQRGVRVGARCKIQSHAFLCELLTVGDDVFVGHGVMFVNDLVRTGPAGGDQTKWGRITIGDGVSIGSNATILPVRIADGCIIGAGSVVTHDCDTPGVYAGNPARFLRPLQSDPPNREENP